MQVKKQQLELDMGQQTGSKLGKEYNIQGCILSPCLFNLNAEYIMRNARLDEGQSGIKIAGRNTINGKEIQKRGDMCMHKADSRCHTADANTTW